MVKMPRRKPGDPTSSADETKLAGVAKRALAARRAALNTAGAAPDGRSSAHVEIAPAGPVADPGPIVIEPLRLPRSYASLAAYSWRLIVIVVAFVILLRVLILLRIVVLPIVVALLLASLLVRPFNALRARRIGNAAASGIVLLFTILFMVGLALVLSRSVANEFETLGGQVSEGLQEIEDWLVTGPLELSREQIQTFREQTRGGIEANQSRIVSGVVTAGHLVVEVVAGLFLVLFVLFFMLKDGERIWSGMVGLFPRRRRALVDDAGRKSFATLGGYLRGVAITATVDAVLIGIVLAVLGVPLVVPLAALTFFGAFIPLVGATLAGIVAALVALVAVGPVKALIVVGAIIVIQQIEGHVLAPVVLGRAVQLHPLAVALSLAGGAVVGGIVGTLLAVPIVAVVATIFRTLRDHATQSAYDDEVELHGGL
jgi:predicted PurR-regulated permease PerM